MGNIFTLEPPTEKQLKKIKNNSPVSQVDLHKMKDKLKRVAIKEGGISRTEWVRVCNKLGINDEDFVIGFYHQFDSDGNEWVDFKEFAMYSALVARSQHKKIEYCFRVFDRKGDGNLTEEELAKLVKAVGRVIKRLEVALPGTTSKKKDAKNVELTSKETTALEKYAAKIFGKMDKDEDDVVHYKEFQKGIKTKEVAEVVDYFETIMKALPESIERSGVEDDSEDDLPSTKKSKKSKGKGKDTSESSTKSKKGKKGSAGKKKGGKGKDSESSTKGKGKGKKGKASKKGKDDSESSKSKKGKKGGKKSKKGDDTDDDSGKASKKGKKGGKKGKKGDDTDDDDSSKSSKKGKKGGKKGSSGSKKGKKGGKGKDDSKKGKGGKSKGSKKSKKSKK